MAAPLIYSTGPQSFNLAFGSQGRAIAAIRRLFVKTGTVTSFENVTVAELKGRAVGILVLLDRGIEQRTQFSTGAELIRIVGPLFIFFRLPIFLRQTRLTEGPLPEEMFIADIAVEPSLQGKGIGRLLMEHAERVAKRKGYCALALDVSKDNVSAIGFYRSLGYACTAAKSDPWLARRYGHPGILRMAKHIDS